MADIKALIEKAQSDPESLTPEEIQAITDAFAAASRAAVAAAEIIAERFVAMGRAFAVLAASMPAVVERMKEQEK